MIRHRAGAGDPIRFDDPSARHAVEVAPRIWWVGAVLDDDPFQLHPYLIEAGDRSVLVDPGSSLTIDRTLAKVREVVAIDQIQTILLHHSDPDCADAIHRLGDVITRTDTIILTEWRSELLLRHLAPRFEIRTVEDHNWELELDNDRTLQFVLTPYLHFPGAFVTYEPVSHTLLSADLFGGFNHARRLIAESADDFEDLRRFHEHYMPSRDILMAGLAAIKSRFPDITTVLPQHGYVIPSDLVEPMFDQLFALDCGVFLLARHDSHLAQLVDAAAAVRRAEAHLTADDTPSSILDAVVGDLRDAVGIVGATVQHRTHLDRSEWSSHDVTAEPFHAGSGDGWRFTIDTRDGFVDTLILWTADHETPTPEVASMLTMLARRARPTVAGWRHDATASRRALELEHAASHDPLTGLLNRFALDALAPPDSYGVLMIDLDHFKAVNDNWGHHAGDEILRRTATAIGSTIRSTDQAFRYGGEEFVVIARADHHDVTDLTGLAERIRSGIERMDVDDLTPGHTITASIGLALSESDRPLTETLHRADVAMYQAKQTGRNRVLHA